MAQRTNPITPSGFAALRARYEQLFAIDRPALVEIAPNSKVKEGELTYPVPLGTIRCPWLTRTCRNAKPHPALHTAPVTQPCLANLCFIIQIITKVDNIASLRSAHTMIGRGPRV